MGWLWSLYFKLGSTHVMLYSNTWVIRTRSIALYLLVTISFCHNYYQAKFGHYYRYHNKVWDTPWQSKQANEFWFALYKTHGYSIMSGFARDKNTNDSFNIKTSLSFTSCLECWYKRITRAKFSSGWVFGIKKWFKWCYKTYSY